jgi:RNA polymerase sigma factor (sigma-70 family)
MRQVVRQFARVTAGAGTAGSGDPDLLRRFTDAADQEAFAEIVRRHGPMVLDVCRCVLGNHADAEDAFQATFLTLARRAGAIRKAASLAAWLHGVAYRTARRAQARAARRRERESRAPARESTAPDDLSWAEVRRAVHEALAALAECYRAPLVLCYLGGMTQDQAAAALGLTDAALKKRLERGREKLRAALTRRGLGPTALLAALAMPAAVGAVPPAVADAAVRLAALMAAGNLPGGSVPPAVLNLVHAEVTPMALSSLKAVLCAVPLLVVGAVVAGVSPQPAETRAQDPAPARADDRKQTPAEREAEWLAGEWKVAFVEAGGKSAFPGGELGDPRITFQDGKAEVKGLQLLFVENFTVKIEPTAQPKEIDVTFSAGQMKGKTFAGCYVTLENEVRICLRLEHTNLGRPKGFKTGAGAGLYTFFLRPVDEKVPPPKFAAVPQKDPLAAELAKSLAGRLVVGDPKPVEGIEGSRVVPVFIEIANPSFDPAHIQIDASDVTLQLVDGAGKPVAESRLTRGWALVLPRSVAGVVPASGYTGFPVPRANVVIPKHTFLLTPGYQDWTPKPGKYTLKGTVTVGVNDSSQPLEFEPGEREPRPRVAGARAKLELKPVTFEVPAK